MPRFFGVRFLFFLLVPAGLAHAHAPLQATLHIQRSEENLEVSLVLSTEFARLLLPPDTGAAVTAESMPSLRPALLAAAPALCTLLDASGAALRPTRVLVSLNADGEVHFLVLYPPDARPARLSMVFMDTQSAGCFCELADASDPAQRRAVLLKGHAAYDFLPAPRP